MVTVRRNATGNGYKKEERRGDKTFDHRALWGHYAPKPHRRINTARPNASHTSEGLTAYKAGDTHLPKGNRGQTHGQLRLTPATHG